MFFRASLFPFLLCMAWGPPALAQWVAPSYPASPRGADADTLHGRAVPDPYRWLEDTHSDAVQAWIGAQNEATAAVLDAQPAQSSLANRLAEVLETTPRHSEPRKAAGRYFFASRLLQPAGLYVQDRLTDTPRLLLAYTDLNPDEEGAWRLAEFEPSPDGRTLAYGVTGRDSWTTWRFLDVATGQHRPDRLKGLFLFYSRIAWQPDSQGFYYGGFAVPEDVGTAPRGHTVRHHRLGTPQDVDREVFRPDPVADLLYQVQVTDDGRYLVLWSIGLAQNDVYYQDLRAADGAIRPLFTGLQDRYDFLGNDADTFYFTTSHTAPNRRVVAVNLRRPEPSYWQTLLPERNHPINTTRLIGDRFIVEYTKDAVPLVQVFGLEGQLERTLELPYIGWLTSRRSTAFMTSFLGHRHDPEAFFGITGQADPSSVFRLDVHTGEITPFSRTGTAFNPDDFITEQVFYTGKDGTRIPMYLAYKKGHLRRDGLMPTWLYAYGFNWSSVPFYTPEIIVWMEMGGLYAFPSVRGGGEYGQAWIEAGAGRNTQTKIDDYLAAAQWLTTAGYTQPSKLVLNGGSSSGPLPATALTQFRQGFAAALIDIPLVDMVRMFEYLNGSITRGWGDRANPDDFAALLAWSPYHHVDRTTTYPPVLITAGEVDDLAVPMHAYKFAAALQATQGATKNPVLLRITPNADHASALDRVALVYRLTFAHAALRLPSPFQDE